jgi:hypothetical protein
MSGPRNAKFPGPPALPRSLDCGAIYIGFLISNAEPLQRLTANRASDGLRNLRSPVTARPGVNPQRQDQIGYTLDPRHGKGRSRGENLRVQLARTAVHEVDRTDGRDRETGQRRVRAIQTRVTSIPKAISSAQGWLPSASA